MDNRMESLKNIWQDSRSKESGDATGTGRIIEMANEKMKRAVRMQWSTILILTITLAVIGAYFICGIQLNETISRAGAVMMTAGLAIRIIIELFSIYLASKIDPGETALKNTRAALVYHRFRKVINGPVTLVIIIFYSLGFYMLTPAFSQIFSRPVLVLIDLSYILIAFIFIGFVRKTIKKEMIILQEIVHIQQDLIDDRP